LRSAASGFRNGQFRRPPLPHRVANHSNRRKTGRIAHSPFRAPEHSGICGDSTRSRCRRASGGVGGAGQYRLPGRQPRSERPGFLQHMVLQKETIRSWASDRGFSARLASAIRRNASPDGTAFAMRGRGGFRLCLLIRIKADWSSTVIKTAEHGAEAAFPRAVNRQHDKAASQVASLDGGISKTVVFPVGDFSADVLQLGVGYRARARGYAWDGIEAESLRPLNNSRANRAVVVDHKSPPAAHRYRQNERSAPWVMVRSEKKSGAITDR